MLTLRKTSLLFAALVLLVTDETFAAERATIDKLIQRKRTTDPSQVWELSQRAGVSRVHSDLVHPS